MLSTFSLRHRATILLLAVMAPLLLGFPAWRPMPVPVSPPDFVAIAERPGIPGHLFAASLNKIFEKKSDAGWSELRTLPGASLKIQRLLLFPSHSDSLFVLSNNGLFEIDIPRRKSRHFLKQCDLLSFAVDPRNKERWFAGTTQGLYVSNDSGGSWSPSMNFPLQNKVSILGFAGQKMFAGTDSGLYVQDSGRAFQKIFSLAVSQSKDPDNTDVPPVIEENPTPETVDGDIEQNRSILSDLIISDEACGTIWLGTAQGAYESLDCGDTWYSLPRSGLLSPRIHRLAYIKNPGHLSAATDRGIFVYDHSSGRWNELYKGLSGSRASDLIASAENGFDRLLAATQDGIVSLPFTAENILQPAVMIRSEQSAMLFQKLISLEPSARDIQKAVVRYANVDNRKTKGWHLASKIQALIPSVSFNRDFSESTQIDLDRGSTSDPDQYIIGPNDSSRGWDFDVSWDLGDILFSSSQTSIDSREKLMVELRHELLAEAIRVYHERRRLQTEIFLTEPGSDLNHYDRLNRLDELTALLDSMTDGFMSDQLEKIYSEFPEFERLWRRSPPREITQNFTQNPAKNDRSSA